MNRWMNYVNERNYLFFPIPILFTLIKLSFSQPVFSFPLTSFKLRLEIGTLLTIFHLSRVPAYFYLVFLSLSWRIPVFELSRSNLHHNPNSISRFQEVSHIFSNHSRILSILLIQNTKPNQSSGGAAVKAVNLITFLPLILLKGNKFALVYLMQRCWCCCGFISSKTVTD